MIDYFQDYTIVALVKKQEVVFFERFGMYQGDWLCVAKDKNNYYFYKGWYGSCVGCDPLEDIKFKIEKKNLKTAIKFVKELEEDENFHLFLTVPIKTIHQAIKENSLQTLFPRNFRELIDTEGRKYEDVVKDAITMIKAYEKMATPEEILAIRNIEDRRKAIKIYGEENFMRDIKGEVIDKEKDNYLIRVKNKPEDFVFMNLKDSSTDRRYMIRVPPDTKTVKEGLAWSFGLSPEEYKLEVET